MQGLPSQLLSKSSKAEAFGDKKISAKAGMGETVEGTAEGISLDGKEGKEAKSEFASLFAGAKVANGATPKNSAVKSETGETLKNLLGQKVQEKTQEGNGEKIVTDPKLLLAMQAAAMGKNGEVIKTETTASGKVVSADAKAENAEKLIQGKTELKSDLKIDQKIAKTASNLDQLLNSLKGTQDSQEQVEGQSESLNGLNPKKGEKTIKGELKTESPLDFLMKGAKTKGVSANESAESSLVAKGEEKESIHGMVKTMSGDDFLKNRESFEKKQPNLTLLNGAEAQKNQGSNVKSYGQGLTLLSDPLIKNTKDLASKETKGKTGHSAIDELRSPDSKVGAELAGIKQEMIPGVQNNKQNHGQEPETQTQANQKVLDLGKINTANTTEIIKRISDYVEQNQVANKSSLDLTVKHESLGEFKIQVSKMPTQSMNQGLNQIDMQITTSSKEGHDFFVKNEVSLMKNLNQAGINLSDLRIVTTMSESSAFGQSDSKQSSSFQQNADGSSKQSMSFDSKGFAGDSSNGKEKRKELWEDYQQRFGA